ncbi:MAG TPA: type II toxin-antitoxin system HicB family antitoxin [Spirochaetota bacterium]|nr:type II toxin-antitoxin system HicB family antitoxin [Spirochaetota bacterium]HPJ37175.1 type II toxin-antitoxin system HicB family antitoxin [Spirochaetota bacterium]HPQ52531.1 type II toxin-antitoxin system HicB family antitoxin [Spirochaetota bacterium]
MKSTYSIVIEKEDSWYVAHCVELGIASQGKTIEEAKVNIREAIELYIESFSNKEELVFNSEKIFMSMDVEVLLNA